jgi:diacylglycerol kinase (ATP)
MERPRPAPPVKGAHGLARSFGWAWTGLVETAQRERNLRVQLAAGVLVSSFAAVAPLAALERALLLLCVAAVVAAEAGNSALEAVVDLAAPGLDERARIAKDAAAGAVLALAAGWWGLREVLARPVVETLRKAAE